MSCLRELLSKSIMQWTHCWHSPKVRLIRASKMRCLASKMRCLASQLTTRDEPSNKRLSSRRQLPGSSVDQSLYTCDRSNEHKCSLFISTRVRIKILLNLHHTLSSSKLLIWSRKGASSITRVQDARRENTGRRNFAHCFIVSQWF